MGFARTRPGHDQGMVRARSRAAAALLSVAATSALSSGCGLTVPSDPDHTSSTVVERGTLRAGAAPRPGWVELDGPQRPSGHEVELVEQYADDLGVEVEWTVGTEEHLVGLLERGDLELVVGGLTDANPWVSKAALTRPYVEVTVEGRTEAHVMMVPMGENAFQSDLERWLDDHGDAP